AATGRPPGRRPREPERGGDGRVARAHRAAARADRRRGERGARRDLRARRRSDPTGAVEGSRGVERAVQLSRRRIGPAVRAERGRGCARGRTVAAAAPFPPYTRDPELHYRPSTHPGCVLPHAWLVRGTADVSTLDLAAYNRFTLLTGVSGTPWVAAAAEVGA